MTKVQHGWEHRSIDEVKVLAAELSPQTVFAASPRSTRQELVSPRAAISAAQRANGFAYAPARPLFLDSSPSALATHLADTSMSPPSKRRSGTYQPISLSQPVSQLMLAPAMDMDNANAGRRINANRPPPIRTSSQTYGLSATPPDRTIYPPSTPKSITRPATLRTQTQTAQAEQDAMDALMLMGSPGNGGHFPSSQKRSSQQSSTQESPRNATFGKSGPRQALQYRSDSNEDLGTSSDSRVSSTDPSERHDRAAILQQIEMET